MGLAGETLQLLGRHQRSGQAASAEQPRMAVHLVLAGSCMDISPKKALTA